MNRRGASANHCRAFGHDDSSCRAAGLCSGRLWGVARANRNLDAWPVGVMTVAAFLALLPVALFVVVANAFGMVSTEARTLASSVAPFLSAMCTLRWSGPFENNAERGPAVLGNRQTSALLTRVRRQAVLQVKRGLGGDRAKLSDKPN